jgi:hypothetical protein
VAVDGFLTEDEVKPIRDAVLRDVRTGANTWAEIKDLTLADFCSRNQDALIDDLFEDDPRDREHRSGMIEYIRAYDRLLDTHRADDLLPEWLTPGDDE